MGRPAEEKRESQILEEAVRAFEESTGLRASVDWHASRCSDTGADASIHLGNEVCCAEVKARLAPTSLGPILARIKRLPERPLLVTSYVSPPMAERLKGQGVAFMDAAGNAYLRTANTLVYVIGRKPTRPVEAAIPVRVFRSAGLRVAFALLCVPKLVNAPYRQIAKQAGVALGSVQVALKDLERLGYLRRTKAKGRELERRERLMDTWVEAYPRELRPRLRPRRFRVDSLDWWRDEDLGHLDMWLGGEPAAAVLTDYLQPEVVTLYGATRFAELARRIRPAKDEHGNLEVLDPFWSFEPAQPVPGHRLTPTLLVYADLVATADQRNLETAEMIRERYLA
jgi:hypothetical protein